MGARHTTASPTWGLGQISLLAWGISFVSPWAGCCALGWILEGQKSITLSSFFNDGPQVSALVTSK